MVCFLIIILYMFSKSGNKHFKSPCLCFLLIPIRLLLYFFDVLLWMVVPIILIESIAFIHTKH